MTSRHEEIKHEIFELEQKLLTLKDELSEDQSNIVKNNDNNNIIDLLDDLVFIVDLKGYIVKANTFALDRLGFLDNEIVGQKYKDIHPEDCRTYVIDDLLKMKRRKKITSSLPLLTNEGKEIPVETNIKTGKWLDQDVLVIVSWDTSEKIRRINENVYFSSIFESLEDIVVVKDIDCRVIACNNTFLQVIGNRREAVLDKTYAEIFRGRDKYTLFSRAAVDDMTTMDMKKGEMLEKEEGILCPEGIIRTFSTKKFPVYDKHQNLIGIVNVGNEITERKDIEHNLKISRSQLATQKTMIEQKNEALSEMIRHIEREKEHIFSNMYENIDNFIMPIVKKLKLRSSPDKIKFFDLLENNLAEITSSFGNNISGIIKKNKLTSREIEICNMIKNGLKNCPVKRSLLL